MAGPEVVITESPPLEVTVQPDGNVDVTVGQPASHTETLVWGGPRGPKGDKGEPGDGSITTVHDQGVAASTWTINHQLQRFPAVSVVDSTGREVEGDVEYVDSNNLTITFSAPFSGTAYLN